MTKQHPLTHTRNLGECKHLIQSYLKCLKLQRGVNDDECRLLAKGYLACRMDKCGLLFLFSSFLFLLALHLIAWVFLVNGMIFI